MNEIQLINTCGGAESTGLVRATVVLLRFLTEKNSACSCHENEYTAQSVCTTLEFVKSLRKINAIVTKLIVRGSSVSNIVFSRKILLINACVRANTHARVLVGFHSPL